MGDWKDKLRELKEEILRAPPQPVHFKARVTPTPPPPAKKSETRTPAPSPSKGVSRNRVRPNLATLPPVSLPPSPSEAGRVSVNVGIDFGTSTTKVCARLTAGNDPNVQVYVLSPPDDLGTGLWPSTVAVRDNRLYFGHAAERIISSESSVRFKQLKVCLGCEARPAASESCLCRTQSHRHADGVFTIGKPGRHSVRASELVTLYLAWVMNEARTQLPDDFGPAGDIRLTFSVSVPLDQIDSAPEHFALYDRGSYWAWIISSGVKQGVHLETALSWFYQLDGGDLPPHSERLVELCSESLAAVAAQFFSPSVKPGLYGVIDIGAWTTELGFFRLSESMSGRKLAFYAAKTHQCAVNHVDNRVMALLGEYFRIDTGANSIEVSTIRSQREEKSFGVQSLPIKDSRLRESFRIPPLSLLTCSRDMADRALFNCLLETIGEAFEKEQVGGRWRDISMLGSGGGMHETHYLEYLKNHDAIQEAEHVSAPLNLTGLGKYDPLRFTVAYGLSFGTARWPVEIRPSAVQRMRPSQRQFKDYEEMGFEGPG